MTPRRPVHSPRGCTVPPAGVTLSTYLDGHANESGEDRNDEKRKIKPRTSLEERRGFPASDAGGRRFRFPSRLSACARADSACAGLCGTTTAVTTNRATVHTLGMP